MSQQSQLFPHGRPSSATLKIVVPTTQRRGWVLEIQDRSCVRRVPVDRRIVMGAGRGAELIIDDDTVSSAHCEVMSFPEGVYLRDLGSTNGLYTGGARVSEAWAMDGTTLTIGQTTIVVMPARRAEEEEELGAPLASMAGGSTAMRKLAGAVRRLAQLAAPVLIAGETGVGKELVARALHAEGGRAAAPFVAMNVAALPRELVESELFGHERGAFTGAVQRRAGAFAEAEGGTLFLDEIGELSADAQPKLLRALDGYEVRRVGAVGSGRRTDVRVVAATHVPLREHVDRGTFRRDLFHRLEVFVIEVPPLRDRAGDVLPIARRLLSQLEEEIGKRRLTPSAIAQLTAHDWPGNVRELKNVLLRAAELSRGRRWLDAHTVERAMRKPGAGGLTLNAEQAKEWLMTHGGNVSAAARAAGLPRTTFRKLLRGGGIDGDDDE